MQHSEKTTVTVSTKVNAPIAKVWESWIAPEHITKWNSPSEDWHTPYAENDLREGGKFKSTMAAKDGSMSFDFGGTYTKIETNSLIEYTLDDDRKVKVKFTADGDRTEVVESFEAENIHPVEFQQAGWQAILDNFKKYAEEL